MKKNPANITALAENLQLSIGTVSRILNGDTASFSSKTQIRVRRMAEEMGYTPNPIARALATGKTGSISLWLPNLKTSYHALVAEAVENLIEEASQRMSIRLFGHDLESKNEYAQVIYDPIDGIITHGHPPDSWLKPFFSGNRSTPIVFTGNYDNAIYLDFVGIDIAKASRQAVEHLISIGRKRVALMSPLWNEMRMEAYLSVMKEAGRKPEIIEGADNDRAKSRQLFKDYVQSNGCPDALFCHNDSVAVSVYRAACDLGIKIPDDMALIGCDGLLEGEYMAIPLSTIVTPVDEMAKHAWQFLKTRLNFPDTKSQKITLDAKLQLRESSES
jgi:LacI family transcriptional regulator